MKGYLDSKGKLSFFLIVVILTGVFFTGCNYEPNEYINLDYKETDKITNGSLEEYHIEIRLEAKKDIARVDIFYDKSSRVSVILFDNKDNNGDPDDVLLKERIVFINIILSIPKEAENQYIIIHIHFNDNNNTPKEYEERYYPKGMVTHEADYSIPIYISIFIILIMIVLLGLLRIKGGKSRS
jgi:hypothetical protein